MSHLATRRALRIFTRQVAFISLLLVPLIHALQSQESAKIDNYVADEAVLDPELTAAEQSGAYSVFQLKGWVKAAVSMLTSAQNKKEDHSKSHKWIVIAFSAICVFILILCIVLIVVASVRRTRIDERQGEEGRERVMPGEPRRSEGGRSHRSSRHSSTSNQQSGRRGANHNERDNLYMLLSTVSEKSEFLEATCTVSSNRVSARGHPSMARDSVSQFQPSSPTSFMNESAMPFDGQQHWQHQQDGNQLKYREDKALIRQNTYSLDVTYQKSSVSSQNMRHQLSQSQDSSAPIQQRDSLLEVNQVDELRKEDQPTERSSEWQLRDSNKKQCHNSNQLTVSHYQLNLTKSNEAPDVRLMQNAPEPAKPNLEEMAVRLELNGTEIRDSVVSANKRDGSETK